MLRSLLDLAVHRLPCLLTRGDDRDHVYLDEPVTCMVISIQNRFVIMLMTDAQAANTPMEARHRERRQIPNWSETRAASRASGRRGDTHSYPRAPRPRRLLTIDHG